MGKKKRKTRYSVTDTLSPMALPPELEVLARRLYIMACKGSSQHWDEIDNPNALINDSTLRADFYNSANEGMRSAQEEIISIIENSEKIELPTEILLRGIADAIAWQLLGSQLCFARRFFKQNIQPNIYNCNFESAVFAAREHLKNNPNSIPLLSDLTSFIQVGDLLICDPDKGITICEVKEGVMNQKIGDFMKFFVESKCERSLYYFAKQEGPKAYKQLGRMFRQASRMAHVTSMLSVGEGTDPDTDEKIRIPDEYIQIDSWDDRLIKKIKESEEKGYAVDVIDNCLFLGCYAKPHMVTAGHVIFNSWFDNSKGTPDCPRGRLIDSMRNPLALPIFNRCIPDEFKFDILFGRKHVCMAICIEALLEECKKAGLSVRFATNKERGKLDQAGNRPYRHKGKVILISKGEHEVVLMDGLFLRIMYHGQSPISLIQQILSNTGISS